MPKTSLVKPENIYADVETRSWTARQDWKTKFSKLPKSKQVLYQELAKAYAPTDPTKKVAEVKAPTARSIYMEREKKKLMADGSTTAAEANKTIAAQWASLSDEARLPYEKRALAKKEAMLKSH